MRYRQENIQFSILSELQVKNRTPGMLPRAHDPTAVEPFQLVPGSISQPSGSSQVSWEYRSNSITPPQATEIWKSHGHVTAPHLPSWQPGSLEPSSAQITVHKGKKMEHAVFSTALWEVRARALRGLLRHPNYSLPSSKTDSPRSRGHS